VRCLKVNTATPTAASTNSSCCVDGVADVINIELGVAVASSSSRTPLGLQKRQ
jgi:hypothetical protein